MINVKGYKKQIFFYFLTSEVHKLKKKYFALNHLHNFFSTSNTKRIHL